MLMHDVLAFLVVKVVCRVWAAVVLQAVSVELTPFTHSQLIIFFERIR